VLSAIPAAVDDRVLIDYRTSDDAGVYAWEGGPALVQTVDFFTPIVDDPYVYGQIAAANAVSDVYAMGGRPLTALAIAGFPKTLDESTIAGVFRGGFDKLREAGVALLGGHTVQDQEIKFGYAVTGAVDPARVLSNAGARAGDRLLLTKPLGTGIVGTAIKFDRAPTSVVDEAVRSMCTLNRAAAEAIGSMPQGLVHACTDVTGFGLIGHGCGMARASGVTLSFDAARIPLFAGIEDLAMQNRSGGMQSNIDHFGSSVRIDPAPDPASSSSVTFELLFDPQTSGGLLVSVAEEAVDRLALALGEAGAGAAIVGRVEPRADGVLVVVRP
jgi:selenide,water dikinase